MPDFPRYLKTITVAVALGTLAVVGSACSSNSSSSSTTGVSATTVPLPTTVIPPQVANPAIAATVPSAIKSAGAITVALDASYPPDELIGSDGKSIVGMDADLSNAIAQTMGLKAKLVNATFDTIIPGLVANKYGMGASSFTDTLARQKVVDFVDYFSAGEAFYVKKGSATTFGGIVSLCGHSVAVEAGTTEDSDAKAQGAKCVAGGKGKVTVLTFNNQSQANLAVSSGRADVGFADSQLAGYIVTTSNGVFETSGSPFALAPYGLALPKGNGMAAPVKAAVDALIADGVYGQILAKWGVQAGAIPTASINGATS